MDQRDVTATAESADEATTEAAENQITEPMASAEAAEQAPVDDQPTPVEGQPASTADEQAPTAEEAPTAEGQPASTADEQAPTAEDHPAPTADDQAPADEQAPTAEEAPTVEDQAAPTAAELAPTTTEQPRPAPRPRPAAPAHKPRTKLVCTIGPATADRVRELVEAGMDVARINFSHGTSEEHKRAVDSARAAAHSARRSVAVMIDLPGRKIRLGELENGEVELEVGRSFTFRPPSEATSPGSADGAEVSEPSLADDVEPGDRILLADGAAELKVTGTANGDVQTEVVRGGTIRSRTGVSIPSERLQGTALTEADREAVPRALQLKADMIAQSFVRSAADIAELRDLIPEGQGAPAIVAKIETRAAVESFDEIVQACAGVMIARGDLGVDLPFEQVPLIQKDLLRRARSAGRFTIVATQMLESMTGAARPTRAEASDVANAVLDGSDAVMLSAETAIGRFPLEAAGAALRICAATERGGHESLTFPYAGPPDSHPEAVIHAAVELSLRYPRLSAVWCFTRSGRTAEMLSVLRPRLPIVAFTLTPIVARRLAVRTAVIPVVLPSARTGEPLVRRMEAAARSQGVARVAAGGHGSSVLLVTTSGQAEGINRLEVYEV